MDTNKKNRRWPRALAIVVSAVVLIVSLVQVIRIQQGYARARHEYEQLQLDEGPGEEKGAPAADALQAINADYTGWLWIEDTSISYPVVRGQDNQKYLTHTFMGNYNPAGSIFMDFRNEGDFSSFHTILYGHNMRDGSMFGSLKEYLDESFLQAHPIIEVHMANQRLQYRIFAVRQSDVYDAAYQTHFENEAALAAFAKEYGAPVGTSRMLTLSTCTNSADDTERLMVHAALESTLPTNMA